MKQQYQNFKFRADTLAAIDQANQIIADYQRQGYRLTLRQLYYQHVARGLISNTEANYKKLGSIISDGRLAGLIDWDAIEDRTRNLQSLAHWDNPGDIINSAHYSYRIDKWANQPNRVEVWIEKEALVGVIQRVCERHQVAYFACRGYVSQSEMYEAGQRIARYINDGQDVTILHLGDHDPSGIDMSRDIIDRLELFLSAEGLNVGVDRLALNWNQVQLYQPPPNPAKTTDSRFQDYQCKFGDESWELDALEPSVISDLIEDNILVLRDDALWQEKLAEEQEQKNLIKKVAYRWNEVAAYFNNEPAA